LAAVVDKMFEALEIRVLVSFRRDNAMRQT